MILFQRAAFYRMSCRWSLHELFVKRGMRWDGMNRTVHLLASAHFGCRLTPQEEEIAFDSAFSKLRMTGSGEQDPVADVPRCVERQTAF